MARSRICAVHGCRREGSPLPLEALDMKVMVCPRHREPIHNLDLEALAESLRPRELDYSSPMGRMVSYSEIFPEYDDESDAPAAQAAIRILSERFLTERDLLEEFVAVAEAPEGARDGEELVVWADPYLDPALWPFLEGEQTLAPYERPEVQARLARMAGRKAGGGLR